MSSDRQHGKVIFICNGCDDHIETDERDFDAALAYIKRKSWLVKKGRDSAWLHYCPDCRDEVV